MTERAGTERAGTSTGGSVSQGMTITLIGNMVPQAVALISGPILAQALGVTGRGEVAAATAPLALAMTLMTFGIPEAITYTVARRPSLVRLASRNGYQLLFVAGLLAMAALYLAREWLSGADPSISRLMVVAGLAILPNLLVGVLRGIASSLAMWKLVAGERILASVLRMVALIPLWMTGHLTPFTATVILAAMPVAGAFAYLGLRGRLPAEEPDTDELAARRQLTSFGLRMWIGSISGTLLARVDQTLMTPLSGGAYQLGLYVVAVNLSELPLIINRAVRDVTFVTDAHSSVDSRLTASSRISGAACAVMALGLGVTMAWWLPWLFGAEFAGAVPVAAVLLVAVLIGTPGSIAGTALSARGRPGLRSIALLIACVGNIVLLLVLVPQWGAMGAAWATLFGTIATSALNLVFVRRLFGIPMRSFFGLRRSDVETMRRFTRRLVRQVGAPLRRGRRDRA